MSYILEALKKSQQERELGRVPSLHAVTLFNEEPERHPTHHWALLAVGLAALAVVIALYAAFRAPATPSPAPQQLSAIPETVPPSAPPSASAASPSSAPLTSSLVEPPPPKPRSIAPGPVPPAELRPAKPRSLPETSPPADAETAGRSADWETLALRQLEAEQAALNAAREVLQAEGPRPPPVPDDLIQEIQSFKEQVRREQAGQSPRARREPVAIPDDPTHLRLTPEQQAQIPAYLMTVHVYDPEPSKRFVVINALRYREGEETREGLKVERILKEGAVLSYLGQPFYVPR